jgi:signal transduction histidine kinase
MATFAQSATDMGNYPKALQVLFVILHANEKKKDSAAIENALYLIAHTYLQTNDTKRAIEYFYKAKYYGDKNPFINIFIHDDLANAYLLRQQNDSASHYADLSYRLAVKFYGSEANIYGGVLNDLGMIYDQLGKDSLAIDYLRRSYVYFTTIDIQYLNYCASTIGLARYFNKKGMADSCLIYAKLCLSTALDKGFLPYISEASGLITTYYQKNHNTDSAYHYQQIGFEAYKTLYNDESSRQIQNMALAEQQRADDIALAKKISDDQYAAKLRLYGLVTLGIVALLIGIIVYRNNRRKQKSYDLLKKQKQEIDLQKSKLESSIKELQTTQSQLIQSEKMASLGELTAGIAHEIQNPLNFVNNFSEVNSEMIDELKNELATGNLQLANEIADDIKSNEEKINHHGKRADAIVKSMLEHSRTSSGNKEPTDINKLCDEYLRLSYHGLRAKDKGFNAEIKTDFDPSTGKINVVPQDIGRVLLNLINNAFYAVNEQKNKNPISYQPTVSVTTMKSENSVTITVKDNGGGIPKNIKEKIFQPFFTTKPTGSGTGLGLSLSYDIVKVHGGELKVESIDGGGSEFMIQLPIGL